MLPSPIAGTVQGAANSSLNFLSLRFFLLSPGKSDREGIQVVELSQILQFY